MDILSDFGGNPAGQLSRATVAECIRCDQEPANRAAFISANSEWFSLELRLAYQCPPGANSEQELLESQAAIGV